MLPTAANIHRSAPTGSTIRRSLNQTYSLVQQLASTYQTPRNPFRLYAIGFGPVFQGTNSAWAQQTLQTMQYYAGTQSSASIPLASNQIITGTDAQMSANLVSCVHKHFAERRPGRSHQVTMQTLAAEFVSVSKSYRSPWHRGGAGAAPCEEISLGVHPGEVLAIVGPNRAGKTTLLKLLLGLCRPTGGRLSRLGRPLSDKSTLSRVGYMHENQAFPRYLSARALLEFYGELSAIPPQASCDPACPCSSSGWSLPTAPMNRSAASARGWSSGWHWRRPCLPSLICWFSTNRWRVWT